MRMIVCKKCDHIVPKHSSRNNKVFGGRICPECSDYIRELANRSLVEKPAAPPTVAPKFVEQKKGFFGRIAQRLFRRRGVQ